MAKDLDAALGDWLKQVKQLADIPISEQEKITSQGAQVVADQLTTAAKEKHPNTPGNGGKFGHLADNISTTTGNVDGEHDGTSTAGFNTKAFVARFLNDGTKKLQGDHWVEDARADAEDEALLAEAKAYKDYVKKVGDDV